MLRYEDRSHLTTMNTPFGRYWFLRASYVLHSAQEVFHKKISENLTNIKVVEINIDDFLI